MQMVKMKEKAKMIDLLSYYSHDLDYVLFVLYEIH
jgi:hypothetical protein